MVNGTSATLNLRIFLLTIIIIFLLLLVQLINWINLNEKFHWKTENRWGSKESCCSVHSFFCSYLHIKMKLGVFLLQFFIFIFFIREKFSGKSRILNLWHKNLRKWVSSFNTLQLASACLKYLFSFIIFCLVL